MSFAITGDGNLAALQKYEDEVEKKERDYEAFENALLDADIESKLDELISKFDDIANQYNIIEDFNEYFSK